MVLLSLGDGKICGIVCFTVKLCLLVFSIIDTVYLKQHKTGMDHLKAHSSSIKESSMLWYLVLVLLHSVSRGSAFILYLTE